MLTKEPAFGKNMAIVIAEYPRNEPSSNAFKGIRSFIVSASNFPFSGPTFIKKVSVSKTKESIVSNTDCGSSCLAFLST